MNRNTVMAAAALAALATSIAVPVAAAAPTVRARVVDGALRVSGTPFADAFALRLSPTDATRLQLDIGNDGSPDDAFDIGSFAVIVIDANGGDDAVVLDTANGAFSTARPTLVAGDKGDDRLIGGNGNELFLGGRGDDVVDGNGGADSALLGEGNDIFVWDPGDGSDAVEGAAAAIPTCSTALVATRSSPPRPAAAGSRSRGTSAALSWTSTASRRSICGHSAGRTASRSTT